MNWININTSQSRDPRYMDSTWLERGAWLSMVAYCTERETDGIIVGARLWSDRQWLIALGGLLTDISRESGLWSWSGDDLHLELYPHDMQATVIARREAGRKGGQATSEAKTEAVRANGNVEKAKQKQSKSKAKSKPKEIEGNSKGEEQVEEEEQSEVKVEVEVEPEPEAPIPPDATADPTDAHTALRAVADLGVEYFLDLKANPTYKALDLQLEAGKANAWAVANRRKFTKRFFVNWINRGLDRAAANSADASLHSAIHPKYGW